MGWSALGRAIRLGGVSGGRRLIWLWGGLSASATALLIVDIGLVANLLLSRNAQLRPSLHRILEDLLRRPAPDSTWLAAYDSSLLLLLGVFLLLALFEALFLLLLLRASESCSLQLMTRLQEAVRQHAARLGPGGSPERHAAEAETLLTDRCQQVREGLSVYWKAVPRAVMLLPLLLAVALAADFYLTLYALLLSLCAAWIYRLIHAQITSRASAARVQAMRRHESMKDQLHMGLVQATCSFQPPDPAGFAEAARRCQQQLRQAALLEAALLPSLVLLVSLCICLLAVVIGLSTNAGMTRVILLTLIFVRGYLPGKRLLTVWAGTRDTERAAAEVFAYLDRQPAVLPAVTAQPLAPMSKSLRFDDLTVTGQGVAGLQSASLQIPAGSRVAMVGSDRSGLAVLPHLLLRYRDPDRGSILIDDVPLAQLTLDSLRQQVAFAAADGRLMPGTIAENIRCGRLGFDQQQIEQAAAQSQVLDSIQPLPHGFHTTIGPRGRTVGPAMAFGIGLARALLAQPSLLIVEEPQDLDDQQAQHRLDLALQAAAQGRALIVLACRLPTLRSANRVYLFHEGRLQAEGDHSELLQKDALYRHLNYLWFNPYRNAAVQAGPIG